MPAHEHGGGLLTARELHVGDIDPQGYVLNAAEPFLVSVTHQGSDRVESAADPFRTITGAHRGEKAVVAPYFVPRYGERPGQEPRSMPVTGPMPTVVPTGNGGSLVAPVLANVANGKTTGRGPNVWAPEDPLRTVTSVNGFSVVAPVLARTAHGDVDKKGKKRGRGALAATEPLPSVLATGDTAVVAPILAGVGGRAAQSRPRRADEPTATGTAKADTVLVAPVLAYAQHGGAVRPADAPHHMEDKAIPQWIPMMARSQNPRRHRPHRRGHGLLRHYPAGVDEHCVPRRFWHRCG